MAREDTGAVWHPPVLVHCQWQHTEGNSRRERKSEVVQATRERTVSRDSQHQEAEYRHSGIPPHQLGPTQTFFTLVVKLLQGNIM